MCWAELPYQMSTEFETWTFNSTFTCCWVGSVSLPHHEFWVSSIVLQNTCTMNYCYKCVLPKVHVPWMLIYCFESSTVHLRRMLGYVNMHSKVSTSLWGCYFTGLHPVSIFTMNNLFLAWIFYCKYLQHEYYHTIVCFLGTHTIRGELQGWSSHITCSISVEL